MMRKYFFFFIFLLCLFYGCSHSDVNEIAPSAKTDTTDVVKKDTAEVFVPTPVIESICFRCADNPYQLNDDVECNIVDDSLIVCRIPYIIENKELIPE